MTPSSQSIDALRETVKRLPGGPEAGRIHEDWKYTSLVPAIDISERWIDDGAQIAPCEALATTIDRVASSIDANWLVIANGVVDDSRFPITSGIDVGRHGQTRMLPKTNLPEKDCPLADLGAALMHDALRLTISAATEKPLGLLIVDDAALDAGVSQASIAIAIAPGCDTEIIEYQLSQGDGDHYANSTITLDVGEHATAHYVRIQERRMGHVQTGHLNVDMGRDSRLDMAAYDLGGGLIRNDVAIDVAAPGANAIFTGLYLAGENQHIDNHTRVDHRVGPATSSQEYRGILNGPCRCVWNGKAIVHEGADGTDASQENHNLLLSKDAEIDAKPELEIYADDVKCSHGTTVGQLDEAALFYLRTRGIDKRQAAQLLTRAFAADLVHRSPIDACREVISSLVESRLAGLITGEKI